MDFDAVAYCWQHRARNIKRPEQLRIPIQRLQIQQLCAAGICHVGYMHSASWSARQIPQEESVDIPEEQLASRRLLPGARNIFKQPAQLQAAEVRAERQSGLRPEAALPALPCEARDIFRDPRVLPNNRIRNRLAGLALPDDGGLSLVGDADPCEIRSA